MTQPQQPEDVQGILNTLLVPMDPPNRSQWRKLELAMKFINISKQSVAHSRRLQVREQFVAALHTINTIIDKSKSQPPIPKN